MRWRCIVHRLHTLSSICDVILFACAIVTTDCAFCCIRLLHFLMPLPQCRLLLPLLPLLLPPPPSILSHDHKEQTPRC
jgi:hypothetical protein